MLTKKVEIKGKEIKNIYNPKKVRDIKRELWKVDKKTTEAKGNSNTNECKKESKKKVVKNRKTCKKELHENLLSSMSKIKEICK